MTVRSVALATCVFLCPFDDPTHAQEAIRERPAAASAEADAKRPAERAKDKIFYAAVGLAAILFSIGVFGRRPCPEGKG